MWLCNELGFLFPDKNEPVFLLVPIIILWCSATRTWKEPSFLEAHPPSPCRGCCCTRYIACVWSSVPLGARIKCLHRFAFIHSVPSGEGELRSMLFFQFAELSLVWPSDKKPQTLQYQGFSGATKPHSWKKALKPVIAGRKWRLNNWTNLPCVSISSKKKTQIGFKLAWIFS